MSTRRWFGIALLCAAVPVLSGACGGSAADAEPVPESTWTGNDLRNYTGDGVLLVVNWAQWASTWPLLREEVEAYRATAPAGVDFMYVDVDVNPDMARVLGEPIVPSVLIVMDGRTLELLPNVTSADEIAERVRRWRGQ